jgi:hypothetical protein
LSGPVADERRFWALLSLLNVSQTLSLPVQFLPGLKARLFFELFLAFAIFRSFTGLSWFAAALHNVRMGSALSKMNSDFAGVPYGVKF